MPDIESDTEKRVQGEMYAWMISRLIEEAVIDGFWFEVSRVQGEVTMDGIDINWKGPGGRNYLKIWGEV